MIPSLSQQRAGDHDPLDLVGPLKNLEHLGIPHQLFNRIVPHIAVAREDLDRVCGHFHSGIARHTLGRRTHGAIGQAIVDQLRGVIDQASGDWTACSLEMGFPKQMRFLVYSTD